MGRARTGEGRWITPKLTKKGKERKQVPILLESKETGQNLKTNLGDHRELQKPWNQAEEENCRRHHKKGNSRMKLPL